MLENVSGETIATEVEMIRAAFPGSIVILEGNNDVKLLQNFFDNQLSHILVAHGKDNAISALTILNDCNRDGILAIVDADFWRIDGFPDLPANILVTDKHDTEGLVFSSDAFCRVVSEYCSVKKIHGRNNLREFFYSKGLILGSLRLISKRNNLNLVFHNIDYQKFSDKSDLNIDTEKMVRHIQNLTQENAKQQNLDHDLLPDEIILDFLNGALEETKYLDSSELSCGHDLIGFFALSLRKLFSTLQASIADKENMNKVFRLTFSVADFIATTLFGQLVQWEIDNDPFKVLKKDLIPEQGTAH